MKSYRPQRVSNVVREVVSDAIANKLNDPRIAPFSSVTRVEVSRDLEYAKVYVSVMGPPEVQRRTMRGLESALGVVQRLVAGQLRIRHCPRLSFHLDESIKLAADTIKIINETMAEYQQSAPPAGSDDQAEASAGQAPAGGDRGGSEPKAASSESVGEDA